MNSKWWMMLDVTTEHSIDCRQDMWSHHPTEVRKLATALVPQVMCLNTATQTSN